MDEPAPAQDTRTRVAVDAAIRLLDMAVSDETEFYKRREYAGRARAVLLRLREGREMLYTDANRNLSSDMERKTG